MSKCRWCAWFWSLLRDIADVVHVCRFSAVMVVAGFLLLATSQGQEITIRFAEHPLFRVWFHLALFVWALETWYWARFLLDSVFGLRPRRSKGGPPADRVSWLIDHIPRILAVGAYLLAAIATALAKDWNDTLVLVIEGTAFYVLLVQRRAILTRLNFEAGDWRTRWFIATTEEPPTLRSLPPFAKAFLAASLAASLFVLVWICFDAVGFGWWFGSAAVAFLGFALIVPIGSLAVYFARFGGEDPAAREKGQRHASLRGYPVVIPALILAVVWSLCPSLDNHDIRRIESAPIAQSTPFDQFAARWVDANRATPSARPVIVATAGGGLRAGYWTTTVLGAIQDCNDDFRRRLFAISGVSGGSLGATVFVTLLGQTQLPAATKGCALEGGWQEAAKRPVGPYEHSGQEVLARDFLAPTVGALLFPDLLQRFVPLGFPDRARALEQGWEKSWKEAGFAASTWSEQSFRGMWRNDYLPGLFLNGTLVESGMRVITSNVAIAPDLFPDAHDFFALYKNEIRPSTAAHNSARFTYVSPAGTVTATGNHVVDGGYFENFGAITAAQILRAMARDGALVQGGQKPRPIVILISNDPNAAANGLPGNVATAPDPKARLKFASESLSPAIALMNTRDARGLLAVAELHDLALAASGDYFQFTLCRDKSGNRSDPALGWVLSTASEGLMRDQLVNNDCGNLGELKRLRAALGSEQ